jgi:hypothetical protein
MMMCNWSRRHHLFLLLLFTFFLSLYPSVSFSQQQGPQINNTLVFGPGLTTAYPGQPTFYYLQLRDSEKSNVTTCLTLNMHNITFSNGSITNIIPGQSCYNGLISGYYIVKNATEYRLKITYQTHHIQGSPFSFHCLPGPLYVPNCVASSNLEEAIAGQLVYFTVTSVDFWGNNITTCGIPISYWKISLTGASTSSGWVDSCTNGTYHCDYSVTVAGGYNMVVSLNGQNIQGSPFQVKIAPGPISAPNCIPKGNLKGGITGQLYHFNITAFDNYHNLNTTCIPSGLWIIVLDGVSTSYGEVVSCTNGTYSAQYSATVAGTYNMFVELNLAGESLQIKGSPFNVTFDQSGKKSVYY